MAGQNLLHQRCAAAHHAHDEDREFTVQAPGRDTPEVLGREKGGRTLRPGDALAPAKAQASFLEIALAELIALAEVSKGIIVVTGTLKDIPQGKAKQTEFRHGQPPLLHELPHPR